MHLRTQGHLGQLTESEADRDKLVETQYACVLAFRPEPDMQRVKDVLALLTLAKKPMMVAGGGGMRSGAGAEIV